MFTVLLHWSSADPFIHLPLHLHTFLSHISELSRVLHSPCTVYPLKKAPHCPIHSCTWYSWQPVQSVFHLRSPYFGPCLQSSLVFQSTVWMYYVTLYSSFKFCRTEFSIYHPLHGRHFLTHHLGDRLRLLETLQKVPALLSLYPFSLISLKQATINLSSSHCSCKKSLCASNVRRPKFHRSEKNKDQCN